MDKYIEKKIKKQRKNVAKICGKKIFKTLDTEFAKYSELHAKMVFALALYHNPALYEHKLLKNVAYPDLDEDTRLRKNLNELTELRGKKIFMDIYKLCWKTAKVYMDKDGCFKNRIY